MHFSKGRSKPTPMVNFISGWNCRCNSTKIFFVVSFVKSFSEFQHKGRLAFSSHFQDINTIIFCQKFYEKMYIFYEVWASKLKSYIWYDFLNSLDQERKSVDVETN